MSAAALLFVLLFCLFCGGEWRGVEGGRYVMNQNQTNNDDRVTISLWDC